MPISELKFDLILELVGVFGVNVELALKSKQTAAEQKSDCIGNWKNSIKTECRM
jgi:hypothetical protein